MVNLADDHKSGVKLLAMNQCYLASYSDVDNLLVIRDWEKINTPLFKMGDIANMLSLSEVNRSQLQNGVNYSTSKFEVGCMHLHNENP